MIINSYNSLKTRGKLSKFFLIAVFSAGLITNAIEYMVWNATGATDIVSRGASGIAYAALGFTFALAILILPKNMSRFLDAVRDFEPKTLRALSVGALTFSVAIVVLIRLIFYPAEFFNVSPEIDVLGHSMGFFLGFVFSFFSILFIIRSAKKL